WKRQGGAQATPVIGSSLAEGTISDRAAAAVPIAATSVTEGGNLVFTLTRSTTSEDPQTVDYTVATGTAESSDITGALSGTVTFAAGQTTQTITVATVGDTIEIGRASCRERV